MALFKILKGDSSRIDTSVTPFHDGYAYFTPDDGGFYIDSDHDGVQERIRINPEGGGEPSVSITATLLASNWAAGDDGIQKQTLNINGITANSNGVIGITHNITSAELEATKNAGLYTCGQGRGTLTIAVSGEVPPCDIPVVVILMG